MQSHKTIPLTAQQKTCTMITIRQTLTRGKMKEPMTNPNRVRVVWEWDSGLGMGQRFECTYNCMCKVS